MKEYIRPSPTKGSKFDEAERASSYLGLPRHEAISIKLRPVMWNTEGTELWNAYVYPEEYKKAYGKINGKILSDLGMGDRARLLVHRDDRAIIIEHETGPELILLAKLALATASIGLAKEAFSFFTELLKAINTSNEKRKVADKPIAERYYVSDGIAMEVRLRGEAKLINGMKFPIIDENLIDQFIESGRKRIQTDEEWPGFTPPKRSTNNTPSLSED